MGKSAKLRLAVATAAVLLLAGGCDRAKPVDPAAADWPGFGRTDDVHHYSPLDQIRAGNIGKLKLAWSYDLEPGHSVTAPVEAGGVVYVATRHSVVTALDASTGKLIWEYDPKAPEASGKKLRLAWGIRGLAYDNGRVFVGTQDGRLIAIDAKTGKPAWSVQTTELDDLRFITGPPRLFKGKVLIGHGGGDVGATRGYVTCYDQATGKQLWRFYTVPGDPKAGFEDPAQEMAAKTWSDGSWKFGGGAVVWHGLTYDPEFNRVYIGTGNAEPWNHNVRSKAEGDNLFSASIVALDADTGKYVWHYQETPGEEWDYDASNDMQTATLTIAGQPRKVLMQASKNGFFYVIDRTNGKLISAEPIAKVTWASKIDLVTGRPVEAAGIRYSKANSTVEVWPGFSGGHNWLPGSFSPRTGLVYLPTSDHPALISNTVIDGSIVRPGGDKSFLKAWDPVAQKAVWTVPTPGMWGGGAIATGGDVVFQGQIDHKFNAYDAKTGKRLWTFDTQAPVQGAPISYSVGGVQYVTVVTGWGGSLGVFGKNNLGSWTANLDYRTMPRRVLTFALNGKAVLPAAPAPTPQVAPADADYAPDMARAQQGMMLFMMNCMLCHGTDAIAGGAGPDLRWSPMSVSKQGFNDIVRGGGLLSRGMPKYDELTPDQVEAIRFYVRARAKEGAAPTKLVLGAAVAHP